MCDFGISLAWIGACEIAVENCSKLLFCLLSVVNCLKGLIRMLLEVFDVWTIVGLLTPTSDIMKLCRKLCEIADDRITSCLAILHESCIQICIFSFLVFFLFVWTLNLCVASLRLNFWMFAWKSFDQSCLEHKFGNEKVAGSTFGCRSLLRSSLHENLHGKFSKNCIFNALSFSLSYYDP